MSFSQHRAKLLEAIESNSLVISYAGEAVHTNEDDYYNFEVNSQFFYLTGLERPGSVLLLVKTAGMTMEKLFIEPFDANIERWTGKIPTKEEVSEISGIEVSNIAYIDSAEGMIARLMGRAGVENVYFDTSRQRPDDAPDYNLQKALEFRDRYPAVRLSDLRKAVVPFRISKDSEEIGKMRKAVDITRQGLENVLRNLKPGMMEYQVQADFEYCCKYLGAKKWAFPTIAGSGLNGCMMHYDTNHMEVKKDGLILLDLGAKYENYCSDITRTYPVNGHFSPRQKEIYDLVLSANYAVRDAAKPGVTLKELNDLTKKVLGEGLVQLGLIDSPEKVGKYYMHSVSHMIGIDCHDACFGGEKLVPGCVISDEPGLYIDEEEIGIRIEDDLLITEEGCEVLSQNVIRTTEEIEAFMAGR